MKREDEWNASLPHKNDPYYIILGQTVAKQV